MLNYTLKSLYSRPGIIKSWSRRDNTPINSSHQQTSLLSSIKALNPFSDSGYVQLPTTESQSAFLPARNRREEEEAWFVCKLEFPSPVNLEDSLYKAVSFLACSELIC
ncbi:hypothetical protein HI914_05758 [Erysiphe necator]|nr:hypothetical protein HI914_05758 [Erysiphe necator]